MIEGSPDVCSQETGGYGLHIQTYPDHNQFTTLSLDGGKPIDFQGKDFTISADIWLRPDNLIGSVCRIITDNGANVDLMYSVEKDIRYPMLVVGEEASLQHYTPPYSQWVRASLTLSPSAGTVTLEYDGNESRMDYPALKGARSARVDWGFSRIDGYVLGDVASVSLRDIKVMRGDTEIRHWKLGGHDGDVCYDEYVHSPAKAENPLWIVDESVRWRKIYSTGSLVLPSVAFDPVVATFYFVDKRDNTLYVYHSPENLTDTIPARGGVHAAVVPDQLMYIKDRHLLLSFDMPENLYSWFDIGTHEWSSDREADPDHDFWNNSVVYNPEDSTLLSFGGYGHYRFNNLLVISSPFSGTRMKRVQLQQIDPRRSSSTAVVDGNLYIFGGWGCHSGHQELSAHPYYDMYRVDLSDHKVKRLWSLEGSPFEGEFIGMENMVYDKENDCFYVMTTLDGGVLLRMSCRKGEIERMSLPIGFPTQNHMVYGNLFYSSEQKKLYAAMVSSDINEVSELCIYELNFPPVPLSSVSQTNGMLSAPDSMNQGSIWTIFAIIMAVSCIVISALVINRRHRSRRPSVTGNDDAGDSDEALSPDTLDSCQDPVADVPSETVAASSEAVAMPYDSPEEKGKEGNRFFFARGEQDDTPLPVMNHYDLKRSCIKFFGGFQVYDRDGNEITMMFTPILKNLLIVLVLSTDSNSSGISNSRLLNLLWRGKDGDSARNSRNVYISRLRSILSKVGEISIISENSLRRIEFGDDVICDYVEAQKIFRNGAETQIEPLLELLFNGEMLPNVEFDFVDKFKSEFSDKTISLLNKLLRDDSLSIDLRLKIANTLFLHDFVNEDALYMKCQILHFQGRTGMAQNVYNSFCREYRTLMGEDYPHGFSEIINGKKPQ